MSAFSAVFAIFTAASAGASGYFYDCDVGKQSFETNWISQKMAIIVEANGQVSVLDEVALVFNNGVPFPARVTRSTDSRLVVSWVLRDSEDIRGNIIPRTRYSATVNKRTGRVTVIAKPEGYLRMTGRGNCTTRTGAN